MGGKSSPKAPPTPAKDTVTVMPGPEGNASAAAAEEKRRAALAAGTASSGAATGSDTLLGG